MKEKVLEKIEDVKVIADKIKNPKQYLFDHQVKQGEDIAKALSWFFNIMNFSITTIIGYYVFCQIFCFQNNSIMVIVFTAIWLIIQYKEYKKRKKYIAEELSK